MLAITFTEKAAAEMKSRVRRRFLELGRREDARAAESAWVSTIHGFCARMLRAHALSAGIDPDFRVLDELEAERIAADAFDGALEEFMGEATRTASSWWPPTRPTGCATWCAPPTRTCAAAGERRPRLEETLPAACRRARPTGSRPPPRAALAELGRGGAGGDERSSKARSRAHRGAATPSCRGGNAKALCTDACDEYREALAAYTALEVAEREHRDHTMLRVLLELYGERYERGKRDALGARLRGPRAASRATCSRATRACARQYSSRFEHVLVDEFQDTNRAPERAARRCCRGTTCSGSATRTSRSTASATPT